MIGSPTTHRRGLIDSRALRVLREDAAPAVYLGGMIVWLLEVPLYQLVGSGHAIAHGTPFELYLGVFVSATALMGVVDLMLGNRFAAYQRLVISLAVGLNALVTVASLALPAWASLWAIGFMGLFTGLGLIGGFRWFIRVVQPECAGRLVSVTAAGVVATCGLLGAIFLVVPPAVGIALTTIPLLCALAATLDYADRESADTKTEEAEPAGELRNLSFKMALVLPLFALVGGAAVRQVIGLRLEPGAQLFIALVFATSAAVSGMLLDRQWLQHAAVISAGSLVVAFLIGQWTSHMLGLVLALNAAAFGMLEPIPWFFLFRTARLAKGGTWSVIGVWLFMVRLVLGAVFLLWLDPRFFEQVGLPGALVVLVAILLLEGVYDPRTFLNRWKQPAPTEPADEAENGVGTGSVTAAELLERHYGDKLTKREIQIGRLAVSGVSSRETAEQLFLTVSTVKTHLRSLYRKTGTENRNDLYRKLIDSEYGEKAHGTPGAGGTAPEGGLPALTDLPRDPVTGAVEQQAFEGFIQKELAEAKAHRLPLSVVAIRLTAQDGRMLTLSRHDWHQLLVVVAGILRTSLRASDTVFRWSNFEFLVVIPGSGRAGGQDVAARLVQKITTWSGQRSPVRVTSGCASSEEGDLPTGQSLLDEAFVRAAHALGEARS